MCNDGYFYAGEDTPSPTRDVWLEENSRSPVYSCYKVSEKPEDFLTATRNCESENGHLLSLEDAEEIKRVYEALKARKQDDDNHDDDDDDDEDDDDDDDDHHHHHHDKEIDYENTTVALTSGLFMYYESKWNWMGSSKFS